MAPRKTNERVLNSFYAECFPWEKWEKWGNKEVAECFSDECLSGFQEKQWRSVVMIVMMSLLLLNSMNTKLEEIVILSILFSSH